MAKKHIKNKENAIIVKTAGENTPKAEESIAKKPTWTHLLKFALPI